MSVNKGVSQLTDVGALCLMNTVLYIAMNIPQEMNCAALGSFRRGEIISNDRLMKHDSVSSLLLLLRPAGYC